MDRIPVTKDSVAEAIQESVMAYWEDRIDKDGNKTGEKFKMRSIVFPSMLVSMAQLIIGICYGIANSKGIDEPSAKDILAIMGNGTNIMDHIRLFRCLEEFTEQWLEQCAIAESFDDEWFGKDKIITEYNAFCEKVRTKTEKV